MAFLTFLRTKTLKTLFILFVAVQVMNICIDPIDHLTGAQDISINEIESCIEFVVEIVMGKDNAIHETDEADSDHFRHSSIILFFTISKPIVTEKTFTVCSSRTHSYFESNFDSLALPIISPPPRS
jgi:hypothetical protein